METIVDLLVVPDFPNTCPDDGARTDLIEHRHEHTLEKCLYCGELFNFWDDEDR